MLVKLKVKNFKSFKNETEMCFKATKYGMLKINCSGNVLKGGMFVGGNAAGKTNAINAIGVLLDLLFSNARIDMSMYFCMFSADKEMMLEYTFEVDGATIVYSLAFDRLGNILSEQIKLDNEVVLNRIGLSARTILTENSTYDSKNIEAKTLFVKSIYFNTMFTNWPVLKKWFDYMGNSVYFNVERARLGISQALAFNVNNKVALREYLETYGVEDINNFFKYFGFNQEVVYAEEKKLSEYVSLKSPLGAKTVYMKRNNVDLWMPLEMESTGNITLMSMLPSLLHVTKNGGMLIVDEFSSAFHNDLEELIIRYFMQNSDNSQMFFVSHSTNLMSTTLLRPDQIYTVDFKDKNGSRVKRVSSEKPRESQNLEKMYLSGVFGGLPNYKQTGDL